MTRRPASFPCNKAADTVADAPHLKEAFELMDHYPDMLAGQHAIRQWEYGMALRTLNQWQREQEEREPLQIADIGGAGSHFWQALTALTSEDIVIVDPNAPVPTIGAPGEPGRYAVFPGTVEEYVPRHALGCFDVVTAISVIEHVVNVRPFLKAIRAMLKPGGLLCLTTDYTDTEGEDIFHFHWMRQRIYNAGRIKRLLEDARDVGFRSFGPADWSYHGHQVYDYSVCSIALTRKDPRAEHPGQ